MGIISTLSVPGVYISYKGKILPLLLFYFFILFSVYIFSVLFIVKFFKHISFAYKIKKKLKLTHALIQSNKV